MVREAITRDLGKMMELCVFMSEAGEPNLCDGVITTWNSMLSDPDYHVVVYEQDGIAVSSCICAVIPSLTRSMRPYAVIENLVTHIDYRRRGYASACLEFACELARKARCRKIMLIADSDDEGLKELFRKAGFNSDGQEAFIQTL